MTRRLLVLMFLFVGGARAADLVAANCTQTEVQSKLTSAVSGDRVLLPSCTGDIWTSAITWSNKSNIQLVGNGVANTIITIRVNSAVQMGKGSDNRVTGIYFKTESGTAWTNIINVRGPTFRVDHCKFEYENGTTFTRVGVLANGDTAAGIPPPYGVVDNNEFINMRVLAQGDLSTSGMNDIWDDASRLTNPSDNTRKIIVETNTFSMQTPSSNNIMDASTGGAYVFRNNTVTGAPADAHSVQSNGRGTRSWEIYNNVFSTSSGIYGCINLRGGTGIVFGNQCNGSYTNNVGLDNRRSFESFSYPPGSCDGTRVWDGNVITTASRASNVVTITTDNPHGFVTGDSVDIIAVTDTSFNGTNFSITVTGSTTFTYAQVAGDASSSDGRASINGYPCRDQIGRGQDKSNWSDFSDPYSPPPPSQSPEPAYFFIQTDDGVQKNPTVTNCGSAIKPNGSCDDIKANRDYYAYTASFDGTSGTGRGTIAARPATCTPFVAYQASDENDKIYKCTATNTWTAYWSPSTYPVYSGGAGCVASLSGTGTFPDTVVNASNDSTFTLSNTGDASCTINGITEDSTQFSIPTNNCGASLGTGANCTFVVRFTPTSTGAKTGTLTVDTSANDPTSALSGTGITSSPAVNPVPVPVIIPPDTEAPQLSVSCPPQARFSMTCDLICCTDNVGVVGVEIQLGAMKEKLVPGTLTAKKRSWNFDVSKFARGVIAFAATAKDAAGNSATASTSVLLY